jgi:HK97 family phage major capsid protein/HK97 family phage prohead protease
MNNEETQVENDTEELDIVFTPDNELLVDDNMSETEELRSDPIEIELVEEQEEIVQETRAVFPIEFTRDDNNSKTITMSVSSEEPVMRDFGLEILSHRNTDINLDRLNNKAPLLLNHDMNEMIGVIENTYLDESRGRLNATVRFGNSTKAKEVFEDVKDNIRTQVSIGYQINELNKVDDTEYEGDVFRAKFTPYEVSLVSSGADQSVGIGRSISFNNIQQNKGGNMTEQVENKTDSIEVQEEIRVATDKAVKQREKDIAEIYSLATAHNKRELADKAVSEGLSIDEFRGNLLKELENKPIEKTDIGLNEQETRNFSILKAAKAKAGYIPESEAAFELEASRAYGQKIGRETQGFFVPEEVMGDMSRTMNTTNSSAVVFDDKQYGNLIDALTPFSTILQLPVTTLPNNNGNITIPRISSLSTAAWVSSEGGDVSASDPSLDTVSLTERVLGCYTDLTRLLLNNSDNFSTENMVRNNLLRATGVALDNAALNGSGSSGEPTGLVNVSGVNTTTFSSSGAPTYAEYVAQEAAIWADNKSLDGNATAYLLTPALAGAAKALNTTGAGSPAAMRDGFLNGFPVLISSQVPANNSIIGDFSEFIVATWGGGIEVEASREALFLSGGLRLRILTSMDFAVKHPVSFCVSS